jgi:hypothetical protein
MTFVLVLVALSVMALLAGRLGADTRPGDPDCFDRQWPFVRRDG